MRSSILPALFVAAGFQTAGPAHACGAPQSGIGATNPGDGGALPANADVLIWGFGIDPTGLDVSVAGQPAGLAPDPEVAQEAWRIEPRPEPGDAITISGDPCDDASGGCADVSLSFTATAPDEVAPATPAGAWFAVYDHADPMYGGGLCYFGGPTTAYVHLPAPPEDSGSQVLYRVAIFDAAERDTADGPAPALGLLEWSPASGGDEPLHVPLQDEAIAGIPPERLCLRVRVKDVAGNEADVVDVCGPCYFRADEDDWGDFPGAEEPEWTQVYRVSGGRCPDEGAATPDADEPTSDEASADADREDPAASGGCQVGRPGDDAPLGWLVVVGAVLAALPRRPSRRVRAKD